MDKPEIAEGSFVAKLSIVKWNQPFKLNSLIILDNSYSDYSIMFSQLNSLFSI